ncbi:P-loop containing nucleoside triphosphate hydrolase protein, partial [Irpex rosettiformis]
SNSFILNVGNDRPNITPVVCRMAGGESDFAALDFLLDEVNEGKSLIRTMVFFNTRDVARRACLYIKNRLLEDSSYRDQIFSMWVTKSTTAKRKIMQRFRSGRIVILFATEVAGMGMDLGDIRRVVQYMIPSKLTQWTQHAGRCGRDGQPAIAILLVE